MQQFVLITLLVDLNDTTNQVCQIEAHVAAVVAIIVVIFTVDDIVVGAGGIVFCHVVFIWALPQVELKVFWGAWECSMPHIFAQQMSTRYMSKSCI